jgi:tripartite-type tricarboxylate transporter receptor subunit TctC
MIPKSCRLFGKIMRQGEGVKIPVASALVGLVLLASGVTAFGQAETYPNRLVRIVHQYTPGGGNDLISRIIASALSERWHQSVIVEPRPGGGGIIGADAVAKAAPDGYALLETNSALSVLPSLGKTLPFDVPGSFAPIAIVAVGQFVLVASNDAPYRSVKELVAYASARPGQIPYSSVGVGSSHHLIMELLKSKTGIDLVHVPYKGAAPQMQDMVGGQVPVGFSSVSSAIALIKSGSVRPIAVASERRSALLPDTPTFIESGVPGLAADIWYGLLAPAGTPRPIIDRIGAELTAVFAQPALREKLAGQDMTAVEGSTPASLARQIAEEAAMWREVVAKQKLKLE